MTMPLNPPPAVPGGPPAGGGPAVPVGPIAPGGPPVGPPAPRPTSSASRVIAILAIVLGIVVILGAVGSAVVGTLVSASIHSSTRTAAVPGVSELDVDASAGSLRIEFADVREAELEVTSPSGADRWTLERSGDRLVVASPHRFGPWFFDGWFFGGPGDAVLRLPTSMQGSDGDISLSAGELTVDGEYGALVLDLNAGRLTISGSADTLSAQVNAGRGRLDLADVASADLMVNAGSLDVRLTGAQPDDVTLDVSAGALNLTVPQGDYHVTSDVSAGGFDNRIGSSPGASNTIHVEVSAGQATLRSR